MDVEAVNSVDAQSHDLLCKVGTSTRRCGKDSHINILQLSDVVDDIIGSQLSRLVLVALTAYDAGNLEIGRSLKRLYAVVANIDVTVEVVSDMSDVAAQTADSNIKRFLEDSYVKTMDIEATRIFQPMGYNFKFADAYEMSLAAPTPYMAPESNWRSQQIRFYFERVLSYLKTKLRDERIMFTVSANPYVVEQLCATDGGVKWVLNDNANIGGVKLDYHFGVMTVNGTRVHIISTMKESIEKGFRICIIPLTDTIITYRQYQFSFNVETNYRNPYTPNIPNIMCWIMMRFKELPMSASQR